MFLRLLSFYYSKAIIISMQLKNCQDFFTKIIWNFLFTRKAKAKILQDTAIMQSLHLSKIGLVSLKKRKHKFLKNAVAYAKSLLSSCSLQLVIFYLHFYLS